MCRMIHILLYTAILRGPTHQWCQWFVIQSCNLWQSAPRNSLACQHLVLLSKCVITLKYRSHVSAQQPQEVTLSLLLLTEHQPCAAEVYASVHTHTNTYKSQKWGPVALHPEKKPSASCRTQESDTMIKRKLSEYIWLRTSAIVWCNHSDIVSLCHEACYCG